MHISMNYSNPIRLLVAEDDALIREMMCEMLEMEGFDVSAATDGEDALMQAMASHFDLVVTDGDMPRMNGFEFVSRLAESHPETPVVMVSGRTKSDVDSLVKCAKHFSFFQKPVRFAALTSLIRNLVPERANVDMEMLRI